MNGNGTGNRPVERINKRLSTVVLPRLVKNVPSNVVIHGDCREILKNFPDGFVDMIITSPPYNFGKDYGTGEGNDYLDDDSYFNGLLFPVLQQCYRVLKNGGRVAINIQPMYSAFTPTHVEITNLARNAGFSWRTEIIWTKHHFNCRTSFGSFMSPSNPYIRFVHEYIIVLDKGSRTMPLPDDVSKEDAIDITKKEFVDWTRGNWSFAPEKRMGSYGHPAMFPVDLPLRLMKLYTYKTATILDPFAGTGTTGVAAAMTGRNYVCIEASEKYCNVARKRIRAITDQTRLDAWA